MNRGSSLRASVAIGAFTAAVVYGVMLVIATALGQSSVASFAMSIMDSGYRCNAHVALLFG